MAEGEGGVRQLIRSVAQKLRPGPGQSGLSDQERHQLQQLKQEKFSSLPPADQHAPDQAERAIDYIHWNQLHTGRFIPEQPIHLTPFAEVLERLGAEYALPAAATTSLQALDRELRARGVQLFEGAETAHVDSTALRQRMATLVQQEPYGRALLQLGGGAGQPDGLLTMLRGKSGPEYAEVVLRRGNEELQARYDGWGPRGRFIYTTYLADGTPAVMKEIRIDGAPWHQDFRIVTFRIDAHGRKIPTRIDQLGVVQRFVHADTVDEVAEVERIFERVIPREPRDTSRTA